MTMDIGQSVASPLKLEREAFVVDAEEVENGGVEIVDMDRVLDDVVAIVIGDAVADSGLDAGTGQKDGKALGVMVSTVVVASEGSLAVDGSPEFTSPNDQSVIE